MRLNRAYLKLVKQLLVAFPLLYIGLVALLRASDPEHVSTPAATYRLSFDSDPEKVFQSGDEVSVLVDNFKPIGGAMQNEISLKQFDYYDPRIALSSIVQKSQVEEYVHSSGFTSKIMDKSTYLRKPIYEMQFLKDIGLHAFQPIEYTAEQSRFLNTLIRKGYGHTFYVDHRPAVFSISSDEARKMDNRYLFSQNVPLGFVDRYDRAVIYNHYEFTIVYKKLETGYQLLYTTVHPLSMLKPHVYQDIMEIQDYLFLSETHSTPVQYMYTMKFVEDTENKSKVFVPKMPLETKYLSKYYNKFMTNCLAIMATPLLIFLLCRRYAPIDQDQVYTSWMRLLPSFFGASVFLVSSGILWVLLALIFDTYSFGLLVIATAICSPLIGFVSSKTSSSSLNCTVGAVVAIAAYLCLDFLTLQAITRDVKCVQVLFFVAGLCTLVLTPGALLGHTLSEKKIDLSKYLPASIYRSFQSDMTVMEIDSDPVAEKSLEVPQTNFNKAYQFAVVFASIALSSVPLFYPASELFFYFGYNRQFDSRRFRCHVLLAMVEFLIPATASARVLRKKIPMRQLAIYTGSSVLIFQLIFWLHFFKGFHVMNTDGGHLFVGTTLKPLFQWLDSYDTIYLGYFLANMVAAHIISAAASIGATLI